MGNSDGFAGRIEARNPGYRVYIPGPCNGSSMEYPPALDLGISKQDTNPNGWPRYRPSIRLRVLKTTSIRGTLQENKGEETEGRRPVAVAMTCITMDRLS